MGSPETCPVCEDFAAACRHPAHYATPPAPADDASGAEAMGVPGLDFQPPRDRTPKGYTRVEAYMGQGHVVVMGYPTDESHSCDALGCGSTGAHVIARLPLPAPDDAVEEALTAAQALIRHLSQGMAGLARADDDMERLYFVPKIVAAYPEFSEVGAKIDAALRRAKESRSDDSRPASGQGGA